MTERLSEATLSRLPQAIRRPTYDRTELQCGVVHIGVGAFHRAHQAPLFDALAQAGDMRWGIVGASLRSSAVRDALAPQDCLYSVTVEDGEDRQTQVVGALRHIFVTPETPQRLINAIASPEAKLVTVTVTEKGYKLDAASGTLLDDDTDVRSDLVSLDTPRTLPGYLVAGLKLRHERRLEPLTIISCDNMAENGRKLQASVAQVARAHDPALGDWVQERCAFPNTMVDRIVPASSEADIARTASKLDLLDAAAVRAEPFSQWIIENRFAGERPDLDVAVFTADVTPFERAKLRLLNGAHSAMAYLGGLAGIATVDEFVSEEWGGALIELLWDEVQPTLAPPPELDLAAYRLQLMGRFRNSALHHRLTQIAMDGSQKIPQRLAAPAVETMDSGGAPDALALTIAAWMRWQAGHDDSGRRFLVDDPLASTTQRLIESATNPSDQVSALLSISSVFPERLSADMTFREQVAGHLESLQRIGARATAQQYVLRRTGLMQVSGRG